MCAQCHSYLSYEFSDDLEGQQALAAAVAQDTSGARKRKYVEDMKAHGRKAKDGRRNDRREREPQGAAVQHIADASVVTSSTIGYLWPQQAYKKKFGKAIPKGQLKAVKHCGSVVWGKMLGADVPPEPGCIKIKSRGSSGVSLRGETVEGDDAPDLFDATASKIGKVSTSRKVKKGEDPSTAAVAVNVPDDSSADENVLDAIDMFDSLAGLGGGSLSGARASKSDIASALGDDDEEDDEEEDQDKAKKGRKVKGRKREGSAKQVPGAQPVQCLDPPPQTPTKIPRTGGKSSSDAVMKNRSAVAVRVAKILINDVNEMISKLHSATGFKQVTVKSHTLLQQKVCGLRAYNLLRRSLRF